MKAASILASRPHPLSSIPLDDDLSVIFELEDITQMGLGRLAELVVASYSDYPLASAWLQGFLEQRQLDNVLAYSSVTSVGELVAVPAQPSPAQPSPAYERMHHDLFETGI